jgi:3-hydroxyisobutyrate dehydrogenase
MMQRIGFVGLGNLGQHLARSLQRTGNPISVTDLDQTMAKELIAHGAQWCTTAAQVAEQSDVVFTCLPSPKVIDLVVTGKDGILAGFKGRQGIWIDMSTNDRSETLRLSEIASQVGVKVLEAPVTGGVHRAAAGQITVLVGGDESLFKQCEPLLIAVGNPIIYMGPIGSAALIKVITNMLAFINLIGVGEALMLAKRGGLDLATVFEAIKESSGNSFVHETESQVILNGSYNINFTMDLACKDLGFAAQFGRELGVPLDLASVAEQTFIRARSQYGGNAWSSQVVKLLEDALGTDLRAAGFPSELEPS